MTPQPLPKPRLHMVTTEGTICPPGCPGDTQYCEPQPESVGARVLRYLRPQLDREVRYQLELAGHLGSLSAALKSLLVAPTNEDVRAICQGVYDDFEQWWADNRHRESA